MRKYFSLASGRAAGADIARAQLKRSSAENSDVGIAATPVLRNGRDLLNERLAQRIVPRTQRRPSTYRRMVSERRTTSSFSSIFSFSREPKGANHLHVVVRILGPKGGRLSLGDYSFLPTALPRGYIHLVIPIRWSILLSFNGERLVIMALICRDALRCGLLLPPPA